MSVLFLDVVYGTDLQTACHRAVESLAELDAVVHEPPPVAEVMAFEASSVRIRLRFWHAADEASEYAAVDAAAKAAYEAYDTGGIEFAFPQQTLWWGNTDGADPGNVPDA